MESTFELGIPTGLMTNGAPLARASISGTHRVLAGMPEILAHKDESCNAT
jgi:hypothetical protein